MAEQYLQSNDKNLDKEYMLDDQEEVFNFRLRHYMYNKEQAMPFRAYCEKKVLPFIYEALTVVEQKRPDNPLEYFAYYLLANNPNAEFNQKKEQQTEQQ